MEANPGTVEAERFKGYVDAGVTRISMGIQSFNDDKLQRLGRIHNAAEAKSAVSLAIFFTFQSVGRLIQQQHLLVASLARLPVL